MDKYQNLKTEGKSADKYPGIAVDIDDNEKVTEKEVKQRTHILNNNPRNSK